MLQALDVTFRRAERAIFEGLAFTVHAGQKVGVVGGNGVGKTTLFELIQGRLHPENGDLVRPRSWRVEHMAQDLAPSERPALEFVLDGHRALRRVEAELAAADPDGEPERVAELHMRFDDLGGYQASAQAGAILHGLGFAPGEFNKPHAAFSGGWRIRLNLARALMAPADLLLLDEPTNHLDLEATLWLESWLRRFPGTLMVIAHDREFLDRATAHSLHIEGGRGTLYRGGYSAFEQQRADALARQQRQHEAQQREIAHMEQFIRRFRAKESKAKQAQSRIKALERMERVAAVQVRSPYSFAFGAPDRMSHPLISLRDVDLGYGGQPVISGISQSLLPGARIGVLGANGAGKSTFLKCLEGTLAPLTGEVVRGRHAEVGYFAQHQLEDLQQRHSPMQHIEKAEPGWREQQARNYLGQWGFGADMIGRPAGSLSGGEKARLVLALIALRHPALLVLDEPTNHLDLEMRDALARALQDYPGAVVLVAHDRTLLQRAIDELWLIEDGRLSTYQDDLEAYAAKRREQVARVPEAGATQPAQRDASAPNRRALRRAAAESRAARRQLSQEVKRHERRMEALSAELKAVEAQIADPETYQQTNAADLETTLARSATLRRDFLAAEQRWLEAAEALEAETGL